VPIAIYAGMEDELADVIDVEWFRDQVKESVVDYKTYEKIGHLGFVISKDMTHLFRDVLPIVRKYGMLEPESSQE